MSTIKLYNAKNETVVTMVTPGRGQLSFYHVEWLCMQHAWFKIVLNSICREVSCPVSTQLTQEGIWCSKPRNVKQPMKLQSGVNSEVWTSTPINQSCVVNLSPRFQHCTSPRIWASTTDPFPRERARSGHNTNLMYCNTLWQSLHRNLSKICPWAMNLYCNLSKICPWAMNLYCNLSKIRPWAMKWN